jgi:hypothetical protein
MATLAGVSANITRRRGHQLYAMYANGGYLLIKVLTSARACPPGRRAGNGSASKGFGGKENGSRSVDFGWLRGPISWVAPPVGGEGRGPASPWSLNVTAAYRSGPGAGLAALALRALAATTIPSHSATYNTPRYAHSPR